MKEREITPMEAWVIISRNMHELYNRRNEEGKKPYEDDELVAEILCFSALREMQKESRQ